MKTWGYIICSVILLLGASGTILAQSNDDCIACHEDKDLVKETNGQEKSVYIDLDRFEKSIHGEMDCIDCHSDLDGFDDFPHEEDLQPVECGNCHDDIADIYSGSLHGQEVAKGDKLAPRCWDCHGSHYIIEHTSPKSQVTKFNIPFMCGRCHKEGTAVTRTYDIPQDSVLEHYSESIHGIGLYRQGLTVTAVCTDCHTAHNVLPHTDPNSSISRENVPKTCQKCHGRIEEVHKKVIRGELWEKEPNKIPVCVDCHQPHEIRRIPYEGGVDDITCMKCHGRPDISMTRDGKKISLFVDADDLHHSKHRQVSCAQCHTGTGPGHERPCATVVEKVDCSICHSEVVATYMTSTHGQLIDRGDPDAPYCTDCHGDHGILGRTDPKSPTYPTAVPRLCSTCHSHEGKASKRHPEAQDVVKNYTMSIHGKGLLESGLVVTAMCTDCHTAHHVLPKDDSTSSINHRNIPETCAKCHHGIYDQFVTSIHSRQVNNTDKVLPVCSDCHESHTIKRVELSQFRLDILTQCGKCHEDVTATYFETFHGKGSELGSGAAAKCHDCHGAHKILPPDNPHSTLSHQNIVATCGKCHEGSHRQFAGYLTHATHHDRNKYPLLFYTFWAMTALLVGTFVLAGTHTLLWLPRSFQMLRQRRKLHKKAAMAQNYEYERFKPLHRILHVMVITSFLGLAVTGMSIKFSYLGWAQWISRWLGGYESAGYIHRVCAVITFSYFFIHLYDLIRNKRKKRTTWFKMLFSENSMLPRKKDWDDLKATMKWFFGRGPRPQYGRWTYWEKFDYFAVFWGVGVIGFTGLTLWFPEFFTLFLPGWFINVATIIHSDEALLATGFIFTIHFFNTHFRPDKFPMDTVIFTGRVTLEEMKEDRPEEYNKMFETKDFKKHLVKPLSAPVVRAMRVFGTLALLTGLALVMLIIYAQIFGYR